MNTVQIKMPYEVAGYQDKPNVAPPAFIMSYRMNLYSTPGVLTVNPPSNNINSTLSSVLSDAPTAIVSVSDTKVYIFSGTAIYVYNPFTAGVSTLGTAASQSTVNATYLDGYVYFIGSTLIGRIEVATNTVTNSWATLTHSSDVHPICVIEKNMYIGHGNLVAVIDDSTVFTANAFDLWTDLEVRALYNRDRELLIGSRSTTYESKCAITRWNTWSELATSETYVPEQDIIGFTSVNGVFYFFAKSSSTYKVYQYGEPDSFVYSEVPFDGSTTDATIYHNSIHQWNGRTFFGVSHSSNIGGVYSFGSPLTGQNPVFAHEYEIPAMTSPFSMGITIKCITSSRLTLYWSFLGPSGIGTYTKGVAEIGSGTSTYWKIKTSVFNMSPSELLTPEIKVFYKNKRSDATIQCDITTNTTTHVLTLSPDRKRNFFDSKKFPDGTYHSFVLTGQNGYTNVNGGVLLFN